MTLNRTIQPPTFPITSVAIQPVIELKIDSCTIFYNNNIAQEIVKCDFVFEAGAKYEPMVGLAAYTIRMLQEGTYHKSATEIAEQFSKIGYFIEYTSGAERAVISLSGLSKHLVEATKLVLEIISNASFNSTEWQKLQALSVQGLQINKQKTAFLASNLFKNKLFGDQNPVGKLQTEANILAINTQDLISFYETYILTGFRKVFITGNISSNYWNQFLELIGNANPNSKKSTPTNLIYPYTPKAGKYHSEQADSVQTSLRIGQRSIDRKHPDYFKLVLANTILGGYFGSRLMKNIREQKGYTYGIGSHLVPISTSSYWLLSCDLIKEKKEDAIAEIYKEIKQLQDQLVSDSELETARNYLIGDYANTFNAPFDLIEKKKTLLYETLPDNFYHTYIQKIREVTAQNIKEAAISHLSIENMIEIAVG
jgi:zinc protease